MQKVVIKVQVGVEHPALERIARRTRLLFQGWRFFYGEGKIFFDDGGRFQPPSDLYQNLYHRKKRQ